MPYVNVTMDVGAAMTAYKVLWNFPVKFKNVMLHLGDFHYMKENFAVMGKMIAGSGFEDIIFQANICSSGCLNGVLNGSHYNRCWAIHELFYEALERLLLDAYIKQTDTVLPDEIHTIMNVKDLDTLLTMLDQDVVQQFVAGYENYKSDMRNGVYGRTAVLVGILFRPDEMPARYAHSSLREQLQFEKACMGVHATLLFWFEQN